MYGNAYVRFPLGGWYVSHSLGCNNSGDDGPIAEAQHLHHSVQVREATVPLLEAQPLWLIEFLMWNYSLSQDGR